MTMLSIFEEVATRQAEIYDVACKFCGEVMSSALIETNHGIIFNGWCVKAMMFHNRAHSNNPDEIAWLKAHGINPELSRFDESHWHHGNITNFYQKKFHYRLDVE